MKLSEAINQGLITRDKTENAISIVKDEIEAQEKIKDSIQGDFQKDLFAEKKLRPLVSNLEYLEREIKALEKAGK